MAEPRLRAHLAGLGATEAQIADLDNDDLIGLAGDLQLAGGLSLTLDDVAQQASCSTDEVRTVFEGLGLGVDELAGFGEGDVTLVSLVAHDTSEIIDTVGKQLLRVAGSSLSRLAEATVAAYVQDVEHRDDSRDLIAEANQNAFASTLVLVLGDTLPTMFRHHMWTSVRRQRIAQRGIADPEVVRLAVGFVDLVGFTSFSRFAKPAELIATIEDFERRAFETAQRFGGRIVKSIGDEVMIAASDLGTVSAIALELVDTTGDDPSVAPRGGVSAGDVLFRLGDYYGPVVNLASRLTAEAVPGEVLTDQSTDVGPRMALHPAGRRTLKGLDEPVTVWTVEPVS